MKHIIALEGPMGAGKSEAGRQLVKRIPGSVLLPEPVDPELLQLLYQDPKTWAGPFQIHALHERERTAKLAEALAKAGYLVFMDRCLWGDRAFALANFRLGNIHPSQMRIYERSVHAIVGQLPPPTILLYFTVTPETAVARIKERARGSEVNVDTWYLEALIKAYEELLTDINTAAYPWSHALKLHHAQWDMPTRSEEGWDNFAASVQHAVARQPLPDYMDHDKLYPAGTFLDDKPAIIFHEDLIRSSTPDPFKEVEEMRRKIYAGLGVPEEFLHEVDVYCASKPAFVGKFPPHPEFAVEKKVEAGTTVSNGAVGENESGPAQTRAREAFIKIGAVGERPLNLRGVNLSAAELHTILVNPENQKKIRCSHCWSRPGSPNPDFELWDEENTITVNHGDGNIVRFPFCNINIRQDRELSKGYDLHGQCISIKPVEGTSRVIITARLDERRDIKHLRIDEGVDAPPSVDAEVGVPPAPVVNVAPHEDHPLRGRDPEMVGWLKEMDSPRPGLDRTFSTILGTRELLFACFQFVIHMRSPLGWNYDEEGFSSYPDLPLGVRYCSRTNMLSLPWSDTVVGVPPADVTATRLKEGFKIGREEYKRMVANFVRVCGDVACGGV